MVNTPLYQDYIQAPIFIGAAANKITGVVKALRDNNAKAYLISLPVLGKSINTIYAKSVIFRSRSGIQFFLPVFSNRYMRIIYGLICFGWFCLYKVKSNDRIIFYNHSIEYILGLIILCAKKNKPFLDIEDAPHSVERGWRWLISPFLFKIFYTLSRKKKFIISHELAAALNMSEYCVVYGAINNNLHELLALEIDHIEPLVIHYGGSLGKDTGIYEFCDAVIELYKLLPKDVCKINFVVTGYGERDEILSLQSKILLGGLQVDYYENMPQNEYFNLLKKCHIGLSLRAPESKLAKNTFPSKVVEITANGLLLISTMTSDIPRLFDNNSAILIKDLSADSLVESILWCLKNRNSLIKIAKNGQNIARKNFNSIYVGKEILNFISD